MQTGFVTAEPVKKSWNAIHSLKFAVYKDGKPTGEAVLMLSDRSRLPLDPLGILQTKAKEKVASLKDIARGKHMDARASVGLATNPYYRILTAIINGCMLLIGLIIIAALIKGC